MSRLRKLTQKARKENALNIKKQKGIFSFFFILALAVSFLALIFCAIHDAPTITTTLISGSGWLLFNSVFTYAIKNKWHLLFDDCSTGRVHTDCGKTEDERKVDNCRGNCFKFTISMTVFLIHIVMFLTLLR